MSTPQPSAHNLKLFMLLLGSRAPGRHVEQHDFFMGIAANLKDLSPQIKAFWRNTGSSLHIDGWREVNSVDGYRVKVVLKDDNVDHNPEKLFFINLGGYLPNKLEEQHYVVLTVQTDRAKAIQQAKKNLFFRTNTITGIPGANAHIDDKYGIDVDDIYQINDMLPAGQKAMYQLQITLEPNLPDDELHLGYFRLDKL